MLAANKENDVVLHGPHLGKVNTKTPGPSKLHLRTPYKIPLNDENVSGKTRKKTLFVGKDSSLFVTPIGPRGGPRRPALTGKTTNAKAKVFAPPEEGSLEQQQQKPAGSVLRLDRPKRSISEDVRLVLHDGDGEYPEIEYIPQCPPELPDIPDDFSAPDYDKLSKSIYRGCHRQFLLDIDEFGKTCIERQLEESERQIDAILDAETEELLRPLSLKSRDATRPKRIGISVSSDAPNAKGQVEKTATAKPTASKRPTSRSTWRSASRPASVLSTSRPISSDKGPSTNTATKPTALLSQRPTSSTSNSRPKATSGVASHSRSVSTSVIKKPLSSLRGSRAMLPPSRPESRTLSTTNYRTDIGHTNGNGVGGEAKKMLTTGLKESAIEACERVLQEDENDFSPIILPSLGAGGGRDEEDPVIMTPVYGTEEEFYMQVPE